MESHNIELVRRMLDGVDRKSTRLNSSHMSISYAVFCLKKKKQKRWRQATHVAPHGPPRQQRCVTSIGARLTLHYPTEYETIAERFRSQPPASTKPLTLIARCYSLGHVCGAAPVAVLPRWISATAKLVFSHYNEHPSKYHAARFGFALDASYEVLSFFFLKNPPPPDLSPFPRHAPFPI